MTVYTVFSGLTAAQPAPGIAQSALTLGVPANVPPSSQAVAPGGGAGALTQPTAGVEWQLNVVGLGAVSGQATLFGSNDGANWISLTTVSAASAQSVSVQIANTTLPLNYFTGQLTTITGTNAAATLTLST